MPRLQTNPDEGAEALKKLGIDPSLNFDGRREAYKDVPDMPPDLSASADVGPTQQRAIDPRINSLFNETLAEVEADAARQRKASIQFQEGIKAGASLEYLGAPEPEDLPTMSKVSRELGKAAGLLGPGIIASELGLSGLTTAKAFEGFGHATQRVIAEMVAGGALGLAEKSPNLEERLQKAGLYSVAGGVLAGGFEGAKAILKRAAEGPARVVGEVVQDAPDNLPAVIPDRPPASPKGLKPGEAIDVEFSHVGGPEPIRQPGRPDPFQLEDMRPDMFTEMPGGGIGPFADEQPFGQGLYPSNAPQPKTWTVPTPVKQMDVSANDALKEVDAVEAAIVQGVPEKTAVKQVFETDARRIMEKDDSIPAFDAYMSPLETQVVKEVEQQVEQLKQLNRNLRGTSEAVRAQRKAMLREEFEPFAKNGEFRIPKSIQALGRAMAKTDELSAMVAANLAKNITDVARPVHSLMEKGFTYEEARGIVNGLRHLVNADRPARKIGQYANPAKEAVEQAASVDVVPTLPTDVPPASGLEIGPIRKVETAPQDAKPWPKFGEIAETDFSPEEVNRIFSNTGISTDDVVDRRYVQPTDSGFRITKGGHAFLRLRKPQAFGGAVRGDFGVTDKMLQAVRRLENPIGLSEEEATQLFKGAKNMPLSLALNPEKFNGGLVRESNGKYFVTEMGGGWLAKNHPGIAALDEKLGVRFRGPAAVAEAKAAKGYYEDVLSNWEKIGEGCEE